jgi:hypothetical protein
MRSRNEWLVGLSPTFGDSLQPENGNGKGSNDGFRVSDDAFIVVRALGFAAV